MELFAVHPRDAGHAGHTLAAESFEDAAIAFVETWSPALDAGGEAVLIVRAQATGHERCYRIDLSADAVTPC